MEKAFKACLSISWATSNIYNNQVVYRYSIEFSNAQKSATLFYFSRTLFEVRVPVKNMLCIVKFQMAMQSWPKVMAE